MNARDILTYGHRDVVEAFSKVTVNQWPQIGLTSRWSPKDVLAHLVSYELLLEDALKSVIAPGATPVLDAMIKDQAGFNDAQVVLWKEKSAAEILMEFSQAHSRVIELADRLGADRLREVGSIPWYGPQYSLDDFIVYANYSHIREHVAQLKDWLHRNA